MLRLTCGPTPVLFVARDPWVQPAPGFPCALCYRGGWKVTQSSDATRRENANSYPLSTVKKSRDDVGLRRSRSSFRCQADEAGSNNKETGDACDGAREGYRR